MIGTILVVCAIAFELALPVICLGGLGLFAYLSSVL